MARRRGPKLKLLTLGLADAEWTRICENNKRRQQGLPEKTQQQLADELSDELDSVITADAIRKAWKRAGADVIAIAVTQQLFAKGPDIAHGCYRPRPCKNHVLKPLRLEIALIGHEGPPVSKKCNGHVSGYDPTWDQEILRAASLKIDQCINQRVGLQLLCSRPQ